MENVIEIHGLTKTFGGKRVVDELDLSVPKGAIFALLGENGAGKTTIIRVLTGLLPPDKGSAKIMGMDCWSAASKLRRRVAYVPERPRYYDWMTVSQIGWFTAGFQGEDYPRRYDDWVEKLSLDPGAKLGTLSKGQYAKVSLALAMAIEPEVLILDEPTSGLDLMVRREFLSSMIGLVSEGRTIIISSHQVSEVERVANHVAFMANGKLLMSSPMDDLKRRIVQLQLRYEAEAPNPANYGIVLLRNGAPKQLQAVLKDPQREALEALPRMEGVHDVQVTSLHLEDIYCALVSPKEAKS
ncbi:MAG TPA: ABC transporter ATP-binding protein [Gemmataceae bacterium]|nr:ABC transporter ATP-binding protein [Gemmataceae bacterium]